MQYEEIIRVFSLPGEIISVEPFGSGHINDTMRVVMNHNGENKQYVLQRMNTEIFTNPQGLMDNVVKVTEYLKKIIVARGGDPSRETLHFYPAADGNMFYTDAEGQCWRMEDLVSGTRSYDMATTPQMFENTGVAFGQFMADLADFPAEELVEVFRIFTIPVSGLKPLSKK